MHPYRCVAFTNQPALYSFLSFPIPAAPAAAAARHPCHDAVTHLPHQTVYLARRTRTVPEGRFAPPSLALPTVGVALSIFFFVRKNVSFCHDALPENYLSSFSLTLTPSVLLP